MPAGAIPIPPPSGDPHPARSEQVLGSKKKTRKAYIELSDADELEPPQRK